MQIWNTIELPINVIKEQFIKGSTLNDLARLYNCSIVTIKRKLRKIGINTNLHNHSIISKQRHFEQVCNKTKILTYEFLYQKYINENFDTKTLSEQLNISYVTIRKYLQKYKIKKKQQQFVDSWQCRYKERNGVLHPSQDHKHFKKYSRSLNKIKYETIDKRIYYFKSIMELSYALYLESIGKYWAYEAKRIKYINHITGKESIYILDFITDNEYIEIKPQNEMIPHDKRLYAQREAQQHNYVFRGITDEERIKSWDLILTGYRHEYFEFIHKPMRTDATQSSYYFKTLDDLNNFNLNGFKYHFKKCIAPHIFKLVIRRKKC